MRRRLILIVLAVPSALVCLATPEAEFPVNTYTTGDQFRAAVAMDPSGNFAVVWQSDEQDGSDWGIFAQRYDESGSPLGSEFQVNTYTTGGQSLPAAAMDPSGRFIVVWQSPQDGLSNGIFAQRFDSDGSPLGDELQVNSVTLFDQTDADVAVDDLGNFVVVWQGPSSLGIRARRFDASGSPLGSEFKVSVTQGYYGSTQLPAVAMDGAGEFVVVWDRSDFYYGTTVMMRRYDIAGNSICGETEVSDDLVSGSPRLDMTPSGDFVVVWAGVAGSNTDVKARRYHLCSPLGAAFRVNTYTTGGQTSPSVAVDSSGNFTVGWDSPQDGSGRGVFAQRYDSSGDPVGPEFAVNTFTTDNQMRPAIAINGTGQAIIAWESAGQDGSLLGIYAGDPGPSPTPTFTPTSTPTFTPSSTRTPTPTRTPTRTPTMTPTPTATRTPTISPTPLRPTPMALTVDTHGTGTTSNLNGVFEAGETVVVAPAWQNANPGPLSFTGTATKFKGPGGPAYSIADAAADYGTVPGGGTVDCDGATPAHDCYQMTVTGARPAAHWDGTFVETLSVPVAKTWTLHVGDSFGDVATSHPFYAFVENLFHNSVSDGCGGGSYCPDEPVRRDQMAVFLLKAIHGASFVPPSCAGIFLDVPCPGPFADWIEQLLAEGITGGCDASHYCPDNPVTRAQMAVFLLKAEHGPGFTPPVCNEVFPDVPCPGVFADWIERLYHEDITAGCGGGNYCPDGSSTRGQMAVFLVKTFALKLYGP